MEASSIVSFNNDSTFQSTVKGDYNNVSVHELALHVMRDRCLLLQRRINDLETDNIRLKLEATKTLQTPSTNLLLHGDELHQMQQKITELNKQKSHLLHHIFMVTCENKSLWKKISNSRRNDRTQLKLEGIKHAPLLRTNTYTTHSSPNNEDCQEKYSESSLEEISLKLINSYIQEKSQLVEQYEQMTQVQELEDNILNADSIGFTYIEEPATDSLKEVHEQIEKIMQLKKVLQQQERDLKIILSRVETIMREGYKCPSCINKISKNVSSENKEIETSDSLANFATPADSTTYNENYSDINTFKKDTPEKQNKDINEDPVAKICPMCGECFRNDIDFGQFQSHVENHFVGDIEPDSIIDNFENISHNNI